MAHVAVTSGIRLLRFPVSSKLRPVSFSLQTRRNLTIKVATEQKQVERGKGNVTGNKSNYNEAYFSACFERARIWIFSIRVIYIHVYNMYVYIHICI